MITSINGFKKVRNIEIDSECVSQRIDNFIMSYCKGLPKSYVYKIIRKGEVRVNKSRVSPSYKLQLGDIVRLPPMVLPEKELDDKTIRLPKAFEQLIPKNVLFENSDFIVLNKPSGLAVHGGSGVKLGLIEILRKLKPEYKYLELVHRLDRDTSGCILIAKKKSMLRGLHELLRKGKIKKIYHTLVKGHSDKNFEVNSPLLKNTLKSGERMVEVNHDRGSPSKTKFKLIKQFSNSSLLEARPITGRTHQIRVHAASKGMPIAGDTKYGDNDFNSDMKQFGLKRLFLHARSLEFKCPKTEKLITVTADYDANLTKILDKLN